MKTKTIGVRVPDDLLRQVQKLKSYCPYRICWGAFREGCSSDVLMGADYDRRKMNAALRKGYVVFTV